jgi:cell division cycle protein 37
MVSTLEYTDSLIISNCWLPPAGPGGLDPQEVFDTLPEDLQEAFIEQDINGLQKGFARLPIREAQKHFKRCVDSGMWVPDGNVNYLKFKI